MFALFWTVLIILIVVGLSWLSWVFGRRRSQVRFVRETLAGCSRYNERRVIASLSTVPARIANLGPTIQSLLEQTRPPDEIMIAVPEFSIREKRPYAIPESIARMPHVRVLHCGKDLGPATKFIAAVQEELAASHGDTLMMVVDDDRVYPRDAVETYLYYHKQLPDAALCFRGAAMPQNLDWRNARMRYGDKIRQARRVAVVTGCGSYFIQPRFFDESLWDYSGAPAGAFYMDDIWISGCLSRRGVPRYIVPTSARMRSVPQQRGTLSLHDVPNGRQRNNNETIAFFRDTWDVFEES
jgi:hypothetical protein